MKKYMFALFLREFKSIWIQFLNANNRQFSCNSSVLVFFLTLPKNAACYGRNQGNVHFLKFTPDLIINLIISFFLFGFSLCNAFRIVCNYFGIRAVQLRSKHQPTFTPDPNKTSNQGPFDDTRSFSLNIISGICNIHPHNFLK